MNPINDKRIYIICGHYGSGKTEVATNLALKFKKPSNKVAISDLDILNPYFRSRENRDLLSSKGIEVYADNNNSTVGLDMPYISPQTFIPLQNSSYIGIYDVGGDDTGARVLRQYDNWLNKTNYHMFCVVNVFRPETDCSEKIIEMINKIESKSGLKITGLINNSNFIRETTLEDIKYSQKIVEDVSNKINIPVIFTSVWEEILKEIELDVNNEVLHLQLTHRKKWL